MLLTNVLSYFVDASKVSLISKVATFSYTFDYWFLMFIMKRYYVCI